VQLSDTEAAYVALPTHSVQQMKVGSFRVIIFHKALQGDELKKLAAESNWQVSWVGDTGQYSGMSRKGDTGWHDGKAAASDKSLVYTDVDTSVRGFLLSSFFCSFHAQRCVRVCDLDVTLINVLYCTRYCICTSHRCAS
jgi:hypothetical protein